MKRTSTKQRAARPLSANRQPAASHTGVAHELNNILTSLTGWTQLAQRSLSDPETVQRALAVIERNLERAQHLVHNLASDKAQPASVARPISVSNAIEEAVRLTEPTMRERAITVGTDCPPDLQALADPDGLVQVLVNLLRNAADASPPNSTVALTAAREGDVVTVACEDQGSGFDAAALAHAFDPSYTTKSDRADTLGGTGVGLTICRDMVASWEGSIALANRPEGGARVAVSLRASAPARDAAQEKDNGPQVLVVDDEPDICDMIAMTLSLRGIRVHTASSGDEAVAICRTHRIDMAFIDFGMSGLAGYHLAHTIADRHPQCTIVFMSGAKIPSDGSETGYAFLKKPFDLDAVHAAVDAALGDRPATKRT